MTPEPDTSVIARIMATGRLYAGEDDADPGGRPVEVIFAPGRRVRFAYPGNGYPGDGAKAREILTLGAAYRIEWSDVGQSKTTLGLLGVEGTFNSVLFEPVDDDPADQMAAPIAARKEDR